MHVGYKTSSTSSEIFFSNIITVAECFNIPLAPSFQFWIMCQSMNL